MDIVKMEHVTKIYGSGDTRVWALDDVNLTVQKGESLAVVGASGSGKSTLLHVMGGVDTVTNGKVIVDDRDITTLKDEEMSVFRRRKIGFVFQSYHLIPVLTVEENIQMPILLDHKKPDREYIDHIIEMLGLKDRRKHLPNQLSGGQQQRAEHIHTDIFRQLPNRRQRLTILDFILCNSQYDLIPQLHINCLVAVKIKFNEHKIPSS